MKLEQVRECDGKCCEASPRFPNAEGTHCLYFDLVASNVGAQAVIGGCKIMRGDANVPEGESSTNPGKSAEETYQKTCVEWPQNSPEGRGTGGCCWQWIDGD